MGIETFVCKTEIKDNTIIQIPENAKYLRMKKGHALFYRKKSKGINNGFIRIPENYSIVTFPEYRRNAFHIAYGQPSFQK